MKFFLRSEKEIDGADKHDIATFLRLPSDRGFALLCHRVLHDAAKERLIRFFVFVLVYFQACPRIRKIRIGSNIGSAVVSRPENHSVIFNDDLLDYPLLLQHIIIPHEWGRFQMFYREDIAEILILMGDLYRIGQLAVKNETMADRLLNELKRYEASSGGKQPFYTMFRRVVDTAAQSAHRLSPAEIFRYAAVYIEADPDPKTNWCEILRDKGDDYFISLFNRAYSEIAPEMATMPAGERDIAVFDDQTMGQAGGGSASTRMIDLSRIRIVYANDNEFTLRMDRIAREAPEIVFGDYTWIVDLRRKTIIINTSTDFHRNRDGSLNGDMVFASLIKGRTQLLIHRNRNDPDRLKPILAGMSPNTDLHDTILRYFYFFLTGTMPDHLTETIRTEIARNRFFSENGKPDYLKIIIYILSMANGFNALYHLRNQLKTVKDFFEDEHRPVPVSIPERIIGLSRLVDRPAHRMLFNVSRHLERYLVSQKRDIESLFHIPCFTTLQIIGYDPDSIVKSSTGGIHPLENTILTDKPEQLLRLPKELETSALSVSFAKTKEDSTSYPVTAEPVSAAQFHEFLTMVRIARNDKQVPPVYYSCDIADKNAVEFYRFLSKAYNAPTRSLPSELIIIDLFLGIPDIAADFLRCFRKLDMEHLFFPHLQYHLVSHSESTKFLLESVRNETLFKPYGEKVHFHLNTDLESATSLCQKALLVCAFGDFSLLSDLLIIEKEGNRYFTLSGTPCLKAGNIPDTIIDRFGHAVVYPRASLAPELRELPPEYLERLRWCEVRIETDPNDLPFGLSLQSVTEGSFSGRYLFHPSLLRLAQRSMSNMSISSGGYWQLSGNTFSAVDPCLYDPGHALTGLDRHFMADMIRNRGRFTERTPVDYPGKTHPATGPDKKKGTGFHIKMDVDPPRKDILTEIETVSAVKDNPDKVIIRKLTGEEFDAYLEQILHDTCVELMGKSHHRSFDFRYPAALANPMSGEIVLNMGHSDHYDPDGNLNIAALRQTIIHVKTHMWIFAKYETLSVIVNDIINYESKLDSILEMFFAYSLKENIPRITDEHKVRLRFDPLWGSSEGIEYERILSEILAVINQYQMLPSIMREISGIYRRYVARGEKPPSSILLAGKYLADIFSRKKEIVDAVFMRSQLHRIDWRLTKEFIFSEANYRQDIATGDLKRNQLPLP